MTPTGSAGSSGLSTTSLAFVTTFRVERRIFEFKVIYLFAFYSNKGAFAVTSSETTESLIANFSEFGRCLAMWVSYRTSQGSFTNSLRTTSKMNTILPSPTATKGAIPQRKSASCCPKRRSISLCRDSKTISTRYQRIFYIQTSLFTYQGHSDTLNLYQIPFFPLKTVQFVWFQLCQTPHVTSQIRLVSASYL